MGAIIGTLNKLSGPGMFESLAVADFIGEDQATNDFSNDGKVWMGFNHANAPFAGRGTIDLEILSGATVVASKRIKGDVLQNFLAGTPAFQVMIETIGGGVEQYYMRSISSVLAAGNYQIRLVVSGAPENAQLVVAVGAKAIKGNVDGRGHLELSAPLTVS